MSDSNSAVTSALASVPLHAQLNSSPNTRQAKTHNDEAHSAAMYFDDKACGTLCEDSIFYLSVLLISSHSPQTICSASFTTLVQTQSSSTSSLSPSSALRIPFCKKLEYSACVVTHLCSVLCNCARVLQLSKMADNNVDIKKFDTTKMSGEELKKLGLEGARKAPGSNPGPGSTLHQQAGQGLEKAGRYPFIMWGVAAVVGLATFSYYRSLSVQDIPGKSSQALESNHPATAKAPSER
ncbi:hypothetical protein M758_4G130900 [Ceratodon purpureus]|nr:hypothetical protein M758_4G130900 [Ceratodon purpureus]